MKLIPSNGNIQARDFKNSVQCPDLFNLLKEEFSPFLQSIGTQARLNECEKQEETGFDNVLEYPWGLAYEIPHPGQDFLECMLACTDLWKKIQSSFNVIGACKPDTHADEKETVNGESSKENTQREPRLDVNKTIFLDIETLGLEDVPIVLIGAGFLDRGTIHVCQFFIPHARHETAMLEEFMEFLLFREATCIVSFNGKRFDLERILKRMEHHGLRENDGENILLGLHHIDLYEYFQKANPELDKHDLEAFERQYLHSRGRDDEITGKNISTVYNSTFGNDLISALESDLADVVQVTSGILAHNLQDVLSLVHGFHACVVSLAKECGIKIEEILPEGMPGVQDGQDMETGLEARWNISGIEVPAISSFPAKLKEQGALVEVKKGEIASILEGLGKEPFSIQEVKDAIADFDGGLYSKISKRGWFSFVQILKKKKMIHQIEHDGRVSYKKGELIGGTRYLRMEMDKLGISREALSTENAPAGEVGTDMDISSKGKEAKPSPGIELNESKRSQPRIHEKAPARKEEPEYRLFSGINEIIEHVLKGWLISSGSIVIDDAAREIGVPVNDVKLYFFKEIGAGRIKARFSSNTFVLQDGTREDLDSNSKSIEASKITGERGK